jgi:nitrite reductase (NO-forming)
MWRAVREWYIVGIGVLLIAGGLFHVIGEIFDKVYSLGGVLSQPLEGIQTVTVAPGGAVITEFKTKVPGNYTLVDHALARAERGLLGILRVEGPPNPDVYNGQVMSGMGH